MCREPATEPCLQCSLPLCESHERSPDRPCPGCRNWCMECGQLSAEQCRRCGSYTCDRHSVQVGLRSVCQPCGIEYRGESRPEADIVYLSAIMLGAALMVLVVIFQWPVIILPTLLAAPAAVAALGLRRVLKQQRFLAERVPRRPVLIGPSDSDERYQLAFRTLHPRPEIAGELPAAALDGDA